MVIGIIMVNWYKLYIMTIEINCKQAKYQFYFELDLFLILLVSNGIDKTVYTWFLLV